ncbi:hypothetical protein CC85DRAFT_281730 [Cutaneotrichosporon oleaginosum]|uniref:Cytochrome b mRNA-processing protein 4 n=1 Tax=Cutaneotrichosporon oleaginosum TaxID=879819 RepID=A0A0J0XYG7_9TREE|nr:uncharacterized protein CC85DRAFT_281730 [Cutaneotrichosporon oleaginosum]KLT46095.1 hypothetical protein CC85DRAFT_281730 [Cutaneotrichosporon oleaginosum]
MSGAGKILWGKWLAVTSVIMGVGYTLLKVATPTEEEFYNSLSPDLKRKVDEVRAQRAAIENSKLVQAKLEAASDEGKVVWGSDLKKPSK